MCNANEVVSLFTSIQNFVVYKANYQSPISHPFRILFFIKKQIINHHVAVFKWLKQQLDE